MPLVRTWKADVTVSYLFWNPGHPNAIGPSAEDGKRVVPLRMWALHLRNDLIGQLYRLVSYVPSLRTKQR